MNKRSIEDIVIDGFPYPIASFFRVTDAYVEKEDPEKKLNSILFTAEAIARFLGFIAISEVIRSIEKGNSSLFELIKKEFREKLRSPAFGKWVNLSREGFDLLRQNDIDVVIPGLNYFYFDDRKKPTMAKNALDELVSMRNKFGHIVDRSKLTFQQYLQLSRIAYNFLTTIVENLVDLADLSCGLIQTIELEKKKREAPVFCYKGKRLGGKYFDNEVTKKLNEEPFHHFKETDAVILKFEERDHYLNFFPFYIYEEDAGNAPDIFYFNGIKGKRLLYCGCGPGGEFEIDNRVKEDQEDDWNAVLSGNLKKGKPGKNIKHSSLIENEFNYIFQCFSGNKNNSEE